jgi:hypothetical protein
MHAKAVLVGLVGLLGCEFDTAGGVREAGHGGAADAAAPGDGQPPDPPPDAASCGVCDDGVACTSDTCVGDRCVSADGCSAGTCNTVTGQCDLVLVFRQGLYDYSGTQDSVVQESRPLVVAGAGTQLEWDADSPSGTGQHIVALVRFDDIFGASAGQVPGTATIASATLTLQVLDGTTDEPSKIAPSLVAWDESVSWVSFGDDPGVQTDEHGDAIAGVPAVDCVSACPAALDIDVTASLRAWQAAPADNRGWVILPGSIHSTEVASSEHLVAELRPQLTIVLGLPPGPPA